MREQRILQARAQWTVAYIWRPSRETRWLTIRHRPNDGIGIYKYSYWITRRKRHREEKNSWFSYVRGPFGEAIGCKQECMPSTHSSRREKNTRDRIPYRLFTSQMLCVTFTNASRFGITLPVWCAGVEGGPSTSFIFLLSNWSVAAVIQAAVWRVVFRPTHRSHV